MAKLLVYLLESSAVLALFYAAYLLVLRKETFFSLNRFFLLGILVLSLLFPFMRFDLNPTHVAAVERPIEEISKLRITYYEAMAQWEFDGRAANGSSVGARKGQSDFEWTRFWFSAFLTVYAIGTVVCLSRTMWTLRRIWKMRRVYPLTEVDDVKVVVVPNPIAPFSFLNYVFVHGAMVDGPEFKQILVHERTHVRQGHSIDLIFVQVFAAFFWFNPVIWQLIKSLKTAHEYIADRKIINSGYSLVEYQTLLLKQLISNNSSGLVHNFNLSFIKKRITMMKNKKSGWSGKVKVAAAIACTIIGSAIIIQCNSKIDELTLQQSEVSASNEFAQGINLPVLPATGYTFQGDSANVLNFTIVADKLTIDGVSYGLSEIASVIEKGHTTIAGHVVMRVDKDQKMGFVRDVQMELRKAERRKILYLAQTEEGGKVESTILLPPTPESAARNGLMTQPKISELEAAGKYALLKIDLGDNAGTATQQKVYNFVVSQIQKSSTDYVVGAGFDDDDTYSDYLLNLSYVKEGFNQLYQERARELFGKDYFKLESEQFNEVRRGAPMAISISEED